MYQKKGAKTAYTIMTIMAIIFLLPLAWIVIASLDANANPGLKTPETWTLANYQAVFASSKNRNAFVVGLLLALGQTVIVVVVTALASYPLSRYELKYGKTFMYTILFMSCLPMTTVMIPVYKLFLTLHLMDNIFGVVLFMSATSLPYCMWMMKNFMDTVPIALEEAAWVDGANTLQSIIHIVAPLMLPGLCTIAIFTFSGSTLTTVTGTFLPPIDTSESGETALDAVTALVRFLDYRNASGAVCTGITWLSAGYLVQSTTSAPLQLVPVLRVDTDVYSYYVNIVSGEVSRVSA